MGFSISFGEILGLLCAFAWALNSLIVRTQSQVIPPVMMNGIRCVVATAFFWVLLPFGPPLSTYGQVTGKEWALLLGGLVIGMAIGETLYLAALPWPSATARQPKSENKSPGVRTHTCFSCSSTSSTRPFDV